MDLGLRGRKALVFGAGSGLGAAIAKELAAEGAHVALAGRRAEALQSTADAITQAGGRSLVATWDLSNLENIEERASAVEAALGGIDILVNNTGGPPPTPAAGQPTQLWKAQFESMVLSVIKITDRFLPHMRKQRWGRVLTSTTSGVTAPLAGLAISNTLRASLVNWSKTLSSEVAADGITCNVIVPGRIATARLRFLDDFNADKKKESADQVAARNEAVIPMKRYGTPEEYAAAAAFLVSDRASYITGTVLRVDGGLIPSI